jgi:hypothetical protein
LFESIVPAGLAARMRGVSVAPMAAFLVALGYLTIYPFFSQVYPLLLYGTGLLLLAGAVFGMLCSTMLLVREREAVTAGAWLWFVAAVSFSAACLWLAAAIFLPWL